jgi:hypothetical protein
LENNKIIEKVDDDRFRPDLMKSRVRADTFYFFIANLIKVPIATIARFMPKPIIPIYIGWPNNT